MFDFRVKRHGCRHSRRRSARAVCRPTPEPELNRTGHQDAAHRSTASLKPLHGVSLRAVLVLPSFSRSPWSVAAVCYAAAVAAAGVWAVLTYWGHALGPTTAPSCR